MMPRFVYTEDAQLSRLQDFANASDTDPRLSDSVATLTGRALTVEQVTDISRPGQVHPVTPDDTAFIQFSSGSTSTPKGIVLTHRNLMTNIAAMIERGHFTNQDISLSWMPLTHDMGLIGFHLCMFTADIEHTIMSTRLFSRRPICCGWKKPHVSARRCSSPNFGYKHFLKLYESKGLKDLDLSRVRLFNGAEPISGARLAPDSWMRWPASDWPKCHVSGLWSGRSQPRGEHASAWTNFLRLCRLAGPRLLPARRGFHRGPQRRQS
ncbi:MAG: AMP-binding protein [Gammaproteobacteria bacterium]